MKRIRDQDLLALKGCIRSLNKCKSKRMVMATLDFLISRYLTHPSKQVPKHLL